MRNCEIYLLAGTGAGAATVAGDSDAAAARLKAALDAAPVASVLLLPPSTVTGAALADCLKPFIALVQAREAAALLPDAWDLAKSLKADGLHLMPQEKGEAPLEALAIARQKLLNNYIVGADAAASRDSAMRLGEGGADYIAFAPDPEAPDRDAARREQIALLSWWAEIFEIPSVAWDVRTAAEAAALAAAGADFIALDISTRADETIDATAQLVRSVARAIAEAGPQG